MKNNPFKKIEKNMEAPSAIKKKVMEEVQSIELIKEIADLVTFKLGGIFKDASNSHK